MRRMAGMMLGAAAALALSACGGGDEGGTSGPATCSPTGPNVQVSAKNFQFDKDCLAAAAGKPFSIEFDNEDNGTPHNVAISDDQGNKLFTGEIFNGSKTETYQVDPLDAGTYEFHCDVHTSMKGTFIVE